MFQKDDHTCYVVHVLLALIFPELSRSANDSIGCGLSLTQLEVSLRYLRHILDAHQLPDPIASQDQNLVVLLQIEVLDLWFVGHTSLMYHCITD